MRKETKEAINRAKRFFRDAYLNTGCEDDEADEHTEFMYRQCGGNLEMLYNEAERYRDM